MVPKPPVFVVKRQHQSEFEAVKVPAPLYVGSVSLNVPVSVTTPVLWSMLNCPPRAAVSTMLVVICAENLPLAVTLALRRDRSQ